MSTSTDISKYISKYGTKAQQYLSSIGQAIPRTPEQEANLKKLVSQRFSNITQRGNQSLTSRIQSTSEKLGKTSIGKRISDSTLGGKIGGSKFSGKFQQSGFKGILISFITNFALIIIGILILVQGILVNQTYAYCPSDKKKGYILTLNTAGSFFTGAGVGFIFYQIFSLIGKAAGKVGGKIGVILSGLVFLLLSGGFIVVGILNIVYTKRLEKDCTSDQAQSGLSVAVATMGLGVGIFIAYLFSIISSLFGQYASTQVLIISYCVLGIVSSLFLLVAGGFQFDVYTKCGSVASTRPFLYGSIALFIFGFLLLALSIVVIVLMFV